MMRGLFIFALGAALSLPGCGGSASLTVAQQQQLALNTASGALTVAVDAALACITDKVSLCLHNEAEIKKQAAKLTADVQTAQAVITAGGDATSTLGTIATELVAFAVLYTAPKAA